MRRLRGILRPFRVALARRLLAERAEDNPHLRSALDAVDHEIAMTDLSRRGRESLKACGESKGLKLHLGCGSDRRPGWINIDSTPGAPTAFAKDAAFICYDLRRGLPLPDACARLVYSPHFFEHLDADTGFQLMRDCFRVLEVGGTFRIALPDLKSIFRAYLEGDLSFFDLLRSSGFVAGLEDEAHTLVDFVNFGVHQYGEHKVVYDEDKVLKLLRKVGFSSADPSAFRPELDVSLELRRRHSFYVEAIK